jgi:hypothetical protein
MTALTAPTTRKSRSGKVRSWPVKASAAIFQNGLVALLAGQAIAARAGVDATEAGTIRVVGLANHSATGGASDGDVKIETDDGCFLFKIGTAGDALTRADVENDVYVIDDQTVGKTHATNTRPRAGVLKDVTSEGAWVQVGK